MVGDLFSPPPEELPDFKGLANRLPPEILFGTSSWNYPGWKGLVYHQDYPKNGAAAKMLAEYVKFPLFRTIGIDSSFYAPPTPEQLHKYAQRLPPGFPCVMKVWDRFTVHTLPRARYGPQGGELNPDFLNADLFRSEVLDFYLAHFRDHTGPLVFEFQTISRSSGISPEDFADRLDRFLSRLPRDASYSVEIRNREFLTPAYLAVLREHNVAHVFNSWTRMPSIGDQLDVPGVFTAPFMVSRVLLRPGRSYNQAVNAFAPYDRIREPNPELRHDVARLIAQAAALRIPAYVLVNNRAEGSAPLTIAAIAEMVSGA
ncbi:MAG TPA: DUF72 domain-containing protein [Gemmatimonadales bacterium]|nr:DUF72 domain-containing protein [Gemmatimonadales bacterium]HSE68951.1 DUF72 domain-containing protein [Gemmatimonadales bacterium]